jgi:hypothetical protein
MAIYAYHCLDSITFSFDSMMFISHVKLIIYKEGYKTKAYSVHPASIVTPYAHAGGHTEQRPSHHHARQPREVPARVILQKYFDFNPTTRLFHDTCTDTAYSCSQFIVVGNQHLVTLKINNLADCVVRPHISLCLIKCDSQ